VGLLTDAANRKWIADFTYVWTAEGWLYVAVVIDLRAGCGNLHRPISGVSA
jgi:transposase InsO family protein